MTRWEKSEDHTPIHLGKKKAAKRLICAGIRLFSTGEDDLVVHLIASSASKVAVDLYEKKLPGLSLVDVYIVPEHKDEFYGIMRKNYNFLKDAERDHEEFADIKNMDIQNCFELIVAFCHFSTIFPEERSLWFSFLFMYVAAKYPNWIKSTGTEAPTDIALQKGRLLIGASDPDLYFQDLMDTYLRHPDELRPFFEAQGIPWDHRSELV